MEIKYLGVALCVLLILGGLYFKFLYDVPDGEEKTNNLVSWFLVVLGIIGIMAAGLWKSRNPLEGFENENDSEVYSLKDKNSWDNSVDSDSIDSDFSKRNGKSKRWRI